MNTYSLGILRAMLPMMAFVFSANGFAGVKVEQIGDPQIDPLRGYAEIVLLRLSVPWKSKPDGPLGPTVFIEEVDARVYDGHGGATQLPRSVVLPGGTALVELRSLAPGQMPAAVEVSFTHRNKRVSHSVGQWQDADGNGQTDWLEARVRDIFAAARASRDFELIDTVNAVSNWTETRDVDCGGVLPRLPTILLLSPVCTNSLGLNVHRLDIDQELTATVLHEARHAWSYRRLRARSGEGGLVAVYGAMLDCLFHGGGHCQAGTRPDAAFMAQQEKDAEAFAQKYKSRLNP